MDTVSQEINNLINFQINRKLAFISKSFLTYLEDLKKDGILSDEEFYRQRKYILDNNGNLGRELELLLDGFVFGFKPEKIKKNYNN